MRRASSRAIIIRIMAASFLWKRARACSESIRAGSSAVGTGFLAMWTRAVTSRGVAIDIGSPASDSLGRSGMTGKINRFFWERFGAALLLSVLDSGGQFAAQSVGSAGSNITRVPSDSASQILQDTAQIRPIVRINQGSEMAITVAKDFDFS